MKSLEKKKLIIRAMPYMLISGDLYKLVRDEILRWCVLEHDGGIASGHYAGDATACKILLAGL